MSSESVPDAKEFVEAAFQTVRQYCTFASSFPTNDDYEYQSAFRGFPRHVAKHADALLDIMDACVAQIPKKRRIVLSSNSLRSGNVLQAAQRHTAIMETVDSLLENVDHLLDEARGQRLHGDEQLQVAFGSALNSGASSGGKSGQTQSATILRPQLTFETPVDNSHAKFRATVHHADGSTSLCDVDTHPYAELIEQFKVPTLQLLPTEDKQYLPLETTPLTFVETVEGLDALIAALSACREVAVDLEHHDFRSFQGITCLMQLSTRSEDYIVDVLRLRSHMHRLNRVFLDTNILKVFHGAKEDVRWLQKDFGLYVANMFDTGIALQTLHMPHSLAFAVDHFCGVRLDKKYQTADWRIRPVPSEMIHYARQDTHYLLYVHDRLKALLLHAEGRASVGNLLVHVYQDSRRLCLTRYEKPMLDVDTTYREAMGKSLGGLSATQLEVLRVVFNWRDQAARDADESPPAIMHASAILQIASKLPTSAKEILACCAPVSLVVRRDIGHLCDLVKKTLTENGIDCEANAATRLASARAAGRVDPSSASSPLGVPQEHGQFEEQVSYRPFSGLLPSISATVALGKGLLSTSTESPNSDVTVSTAFTPSAWFRAMQAVENRTAATSSDPLVPLPGANILARVAAAQEQQRQANAAKAAAKLLGPLPETYGRNGDENEEDLDADCIQFSREEEAAEGLETPTAPGASDEEVPAKKPQTLEDMTSVYEELGTGRSGRRKAQKELANKKRNRNE
uniref:Exosome subunit Rrp6P n=1 Tax=Bodo saltans TaxID=75058 RepID=B6DTH8_BODSA|nr:exosome subunit Rrp6P [Bodo saltans]